MTTNKPMFEELFRVFEVWDVGQPPPEKRLLWAVLERSIRDLLLPRDESRQLAAVDAKIFFEYNGDEPFSFLWICEFLEINPDKARKGIKLLEGYTITSNGRVVKKYKQLHHLRRSYVAELFTSRIPGLQAVTVQLTDEPLPETPCSDQAA